MPVTHLVHTILRPGVQSIQVQYKYQSAETWTNYRDGQRIPGGVVVKFTVTTYENFTLTDWEAFYSDEYDDTVELTLSPITGESSWTFILPSADVYIRCEAASSGGGGSGVNPEYRNSGSFNFKSLVSFDDMMAYAISNGMNEPEENEIYLNALGQMRDIIANHPGYAYTISVPKFPLNVSSGGYMFTFTLLDYQCPNEISLGGGKTIVGSLTISGSKVYGENRWVALGTASYGFNVAFVGSSTQNNFLYISAISGDTPSASANSIRYIMSPENSGEVDASAPSEFVHGTTEFTFKWRIKAAYEFRRLTPFAVGDGPLEDDVVHSLEYDGDTRTYTFTVQQIPDWAIGVRVLIETIMTDDPNNPIGDNGSDGPIGGDGTFDDSSDEVPLPAIPEGVSAADTGFVTLFRPTIQQLRDMSDYMWSNLSEFIENLQKIFTNPMDYIISLASFPVTPNVGPERAIKIGNFLSTITMPPIIRQFYEFNCGIVTIPKYFDSFLDHAPNTKARIMLPFIGDADLSINEIMGKTLHLWYRIDLLSGSCVAVLTIDNSVYYQWAGNCSISIPVTASDFSRIYAGIARVGVTAAAVAAGGLYLGAAASAASRWNAANSGWHSYGGIDQGFSAPPNFGVPGLPAHHGQLSTEFAGDRGPRLDMGDFMSYTPPLDIPSKRSRAVAAAAGGAFVGNNIMNAIPRVQHAGGMSGNIGIMGNRTPFIVLEYPNVSMPENYKHVFGYPSNMYKVLGNLAGYTKCKQVLFESTKATDDEYEMVISALKGGVYL